MDKKKTTILLAADHAGYDHKMALLEHLKGAGWKVEDMGPENPDPEDDYPVVMIPVGMRLAEDIAEKGETTCAFIFGGSGQGEAMVVNRFPGVRAVVYYGEPAFGAAGETAEKNDLSIVTLSRQHNNANALSFGARFLTREQVIAAADLWLATAFSGEERHVRRIAEIDEIS